MRIYIKKFMLRFLRNILIGAVVLILLMVIKLIFLKETRLSSDAYLFSLFNLIGITIGQTSSDTKDEWYEPNFIID